jgi:deoxyadenosine/deoxycytidine kinase
MPKHIIIAGCIGIGKTALTEALVEKYPQLFALIEEPVQKWVDSKFLEAFYGDEKHFALSFQQFAFITRLGEYVRVVNENPNMKFLVFDSHFSLDRGTFVQTLFEEGKLSQQEVNFYEAHQQVAAEIAPGINVIDYFFLLDGNVDLSMERIRERSRTEEVGIPKDYLERLQTNYARMFGELCVNIAKVRLDATRSVDQLVQDVFDVLISDKKC